MSIRLRFNKATIAGVVLAKVGNPSRHEELQTSKEVCRIKEKDQEVLSRIFLKPFRNLDGHCFHHHSSLQQNEIYMCAKAIFGSEGGLLEKGCDIAKRLYAKSNHPNIKSGDLCLALMTGIFAENEPVEALCILKSETVQPFLSIAAKNGDLQLSTKQGINPDKIDKGCLILNRGEEDGFHVLTFDRGGGPTRFWVKEFLGLKPISDDDYLTDQYADLAVSFVKGESERAGSDVPSRAVEAKRAMDYFDKREQFSMQEFEEEVLRKDPEMIAKFKDYKASVEKESGQKLGDKFGISAKKVSKVMKRIGGVMKLDTGVEVRLKPDFQEDSLERGFDEERGMKFVKVYYQRDLAQEEGAAEERVA